MLRQGQLYKRRQLSRPLPPVGDGNISGGGVVEMSGMERENVEEATIADMAASPKGEAGAVETPAPKRRGRPPGGGRSAAGRAKPAEAGPGGAAAEMGRGEEKAGIAVETERGEAKAAEAGAVGAANTPAPRPRRGSKAAALAAQQAEEEALELQQLTAPHIPNCSPEWQQFYLKVRRVALRER